MISTKVWQHSIKLRMARPELCRPSLRSGTHEKKEQGQAHRYRLGFQARLIPKSLLTFARHGKVSYRSDPRLLLAMGISQAHFRILSCYGRSKHSGDRRDPRSQDSADGYEILPLAQKHSASVRTMNQKMFAGRVK